jgi:hypothetical protein
VGVSYSHTAATDASAVTNSTTWSEETEVSRTFASDQSNVTLGITMPDNVVGISGIESSRDGSTWSSVSPSSWSLEGTDLSVDVGDVSANESVSIRAVGDKTRIRSGGIDVLEPTAEGNDLSTKMQITDAAGTEPVAIEVSETAVSDQIHMVASSEWSAAEYHTTTADGSETLFLPNAVAGSTATIETAPIKADPKTGDVSVSVDNRSEPRFTVEPGSVSGDSVEIAFLDTTSGVYYELYSVDEQRQVDLDQASSPVYLSTDDRSSTYLIRETEPPDASIVGAGVSGGGGLSSALLLLAGLVGVGGTAIVSNRLGLGRRVTIPVAIVAAIGIAELGTSASVLSTLSNDLIRGSSTSLVAGIATAGGLVGAWLLDSRTGISIPSWLYAAIGLGGSAWLGSSILGEAGSSIVAIVVGGGILAALWGASRRFSIPRWLLGIVGAGTVLFMIRTVAPGLLEGLVAAVADGATRIAPLVVLGVLAVVIVWLRRRGDSTSIVVRGD